MNRLRQVINGILVALIPAGIVAGGLSLALVEGQFSSASFLPQSVNEDRSGNGAPTGAVLTPIPPPAEGVVSDGPALVEPDASELCPAPTGWTMITIGLGDTLPELAQHFGLSEAELMQVNCLHTDALVAGSTLLVPLQGKTPTPTSGAVAACGRPAGWVAYQVEPNDTLFGLSILLNVSVAELQFANCLGSSTVIKTSEQLWVPRLPFRSATPKPSATRTSTPAPTQTAVATKAMPTLTPSATSPPPSSTPTATAVPASPTHTQTLTEQVPSATPTPSETPSPPDPPPSSSPTADPTQVSTSTDELGTPTSAIGGLGGAAKKQTLRVSKADTIPS